MIQIAYTCPVCGGDLQPYMLASNPPINGFQCLKCGFQHEQERDEIVKISLEDLIKKTKENII